MFDALYIEEELPVSASAQMKSDFDGPDDRQLADDIARVMHHRPLMSRLARVEAEHGNAEAHTAKPTPQAIPESSASAEIAASPPRPADARSIEEVIDDLDQAPAPPPSAEWLDNARRAHRTARLRHAAAWATTLAIAVAIIGVALLLLRT